MSILHTVALTNKGEFRKANLPLSSEATLTLDSIQKYLKKKDKPEKLASYEYDKKYIFVFGYKQGKKGTESKFQLPPPFSSISLFGDAVVIASMTPSWECPVPFTVDQWTRLTEEEKEEEEEDQEEEEEDQEEEDDDVLSETDNKSVKDEYEEEEEETAEEDVEEEQEEQELEPIVMKKKRTPIYSKVDTSALKEEIDLHSPVDSHPLRIKALHSLSFLEKDFSKEEIQELEKKIFESTYQMAQRQYIPRNWKYPQFIEIYRQTLRSILFNLHPESPVKNHRLLTRVKEGEFTLPSIPFMTSYEMFPENWFALKDKLLQREQKILEGNKSRATDQFKCRRCQKRECTYYELQTRSADEPMTIFITCLNCGKEWRQGG